MEIRDVELEARSNLSWGNPKSYLNTLSAIKFMSSLGAISALSMMVPAIVQMNYLLLVYSIGIVIITLITTGILHISINSRIPNKYSNGTIRKAKQVIEGVPGALFAPYNEGEERSREAVLKRLYDKRMIGKPRYEEGICNIYLGLKPLYKEDRAKYDERCKEFLDKHEFL